MQFCLTAFMALIVILTLFSLIDERLLDWEEHRCAPTEGEHFLAYLERMEGIGLLQPLNLWLMHTVFDGRIIASRIVSLFAAMVALCFAVLFCSRVTGRKELSFFFLFALGMNAFFVDYARWGHATYIVGLAYSIPMFYLFLRIHQGEFTSKERLLLFIGAALGVFLDRRTGSVLMAAGVAAVLAAHFIERPQARPPLRRKIKDLLCTTPFLLMFATHGWRYVVLGLPWLFQKDHTLRHSPTHYRSHLYFKFNADYPKNLFGLLHFYVDRTWDLLLGFFHPVGAIGSFVPVVFIALFAIAVLVAIALLMRRRVHDRAFVLLFFSIGILVCYALNLASLYPFGQPRYCLFLMYPAVILAAFGLSDVVSFSTRLLRKHSDRSLRIVYVIVCTFLCFIAVEKLYGESALRITRGAAARDIISIMRRETDLLLTIPRHSCLVERNAPLNKATMFELSDDVEEVQRRLEDPACKTVTLITWTPRVKDGPPGLMSILEESHVQEEQVTLFPDNQYRKLFRKYNVIARIFKRASTRSHS